MQRTYCAIFGILLLWNLTACKKKTASFVSDSKSAYAYDQPCGSESTPEQKRGCEIWYKATAGNERFHQYIFPQKIGVVIDWNRVFGSSNRDRRFKTWGLINDPDCKPGNAETFYFDICPGDEELLKYVGKEGYRDPACNLDDADDGRKRESSCYLSFGTSIGSVGYRKYPNPKFDKIAWKGWDKYNPADPSVEAPFLVGISCASCHAAFDPSKPPKDPEHPAWENIRIDIGNQYLHISELLSSGMPSNTLESQIFATVRPGVTDTSMVPHDMVNNPGTINAIINFDKRPTFPHTMNRWDYNKEAGKWEYKQNKTQEVFQILKGGEDSVGADLAIQRVYVNIGMCAETCWMNHLMDFRVMEGRGGRQTPFDIQQCRRDCPNWRALEERVDDVISFLIDRRPTDLKDAKDVDGSGGERFITSDKQKLEEGRKIFAKNCARCHSSQEPGLPGQNKDEGFFLSLDYHKEDEKGVRVDWLGNDQLSSASEVETYRCRALHSNHMQDHIWEEFGSETLRGKSTPPAIPELAGKSGGGRGYYRNISLLSVWAHAPFMHNNGIGPEFCNDEFYGQKYPCLDPVNDKLWTVSGRVKVFEESMKELLTPPEKRVPRTTVTTKEILFPVGTQYESVSEDEGDAKLAHLRIPAGTPVGIIGSLDHKNFVNEQLAVVDAKVKDTDYLKRFKALGDHLTELTKDRDKLLQTLAKHSNCTDLAENKGHSFGTNLSDQEKEALIEFMKTL